MRRIKIGFIGGSGHHYLRQILGRLPEIDFEVAVGSDGKDRDAARRFFETIQAYAPQAQWSDDGLALLDAFAPDLLSVGSVYGFNGDWNAAALQRGIAVVSDKPIAATWKQLERIEAIFKSHPQSVLLTEFDFRCRPEFRAARQAVSDGMIGDVVLASGQKSYRFGTRPAWYGDRISYGGTLLWIASHAIDAIDFVTGKPFETFTGTGGNLSKPQIGTGEDHVVLLGTLAGGGTAIVHADFLRPQAATTHGDDQIRVAGGKGVIEIRDARAMLMTNDLRPTDITERAAAPVSVGYELYRAAVEGDTTSFSTAKSLATARVLLHAREAADTRQWRRADGAA